MKHSCIAVYRISCLIKKKKKRKRNKINFPCERYNDVRFLRVQLSDSEILSKKTKNR